jgi:hypothetical protein
MSLYDDDLAFDDLDGEALRKRLGFAPLEADRTREKQRRAQQRSSREQRAGAPPVIEEQHTGQPRHGRLSRWLEAERDDDQTLEAIAALTARTSDIEAALAILIERPAVVAPATPGLGESEAVHRVQAAMAEIHSTLARLAAATARLVERAASSSSGMAHGIQLVLQHVREVDQRVARIEAAIPRRPAPEPDPEPARPAPEPVPEPVVSTPPAPVLFDHEREEPAGAGRDGDEDEYVGEPTQVVRIVEHGPERSPWGGPAPRPPADE